MESTPQREGPHLTQMTQAVHPLHTPVPTANQCSQLSFHPSSDLFYMLCRCSPHSPTSAVGVCGAPRAYSFSRPQYTCLRGLDQPEVQCLSKTNATTPLGLCVLCWYQPKNMLFFVLFIFLVNSFLNPSPPGCQAILVPLRCNNNTDIVFPPSFYNTTFPCSDIIRRS